LRDVFFLCDEAEGLFLAFKKADRSHCLVQFGLSVTLFPDADDDNRRTAIKGTCLMTLSGSNSSLSLEHQTSSVVVNRTLLNWITLWFKRLLTISDKLTTLPTATPLPTMTEKP